MTPQEELELETSLRNTLGKILAEQITRMLVDVKRNHEESKRLNDQRYENGVERLTRIEMKLDEIKKEIEK